MLTPIVLSTNQPGTCLVVLCDDYFEYSRQPFVGWDSWKVRLAGEGEENADPMEWKKLPSVIRVTCQPGDGSAGRR